MNCPSPREPRILPRSEHSVSRENIHKNAIKVLYRLHNSGYKAYLVGGGVRDLMLARQPKDFDISTDARPNEIRKLFRNSRIIGRRFRLAHIMFREGVIEVSTFRRDPDPRRQDREPGELLVTSDNTFGTPREDAHRRDFTVNALFYSIADFSIIDYIGGIDDLQRKLIRVIGDPDLRFREDPVRMLRACEFAGRLGFAIEERTQTSIQENRRDVDKASPARLTEELVQLLRCGHAGAAFQWMLDLGLLEILLPEANAMMAAKDRRIGDFTRILPVIDRMVSEDREVSDTGLLAALLVPPITLRRYEIESSQGRAMSRPALRKLVEETVEPFFTRFALSNLKARHTCKALETFYRLCEPQGTVAERLSLASKPHFNDALLLFEILVAATGEGHEALEGWRLIAQQARAPSLPEGGKPRPRRRRRRRRRVRPPRAPGNA